MEAPLLFIAEDNDEDFEIMATALQEIGAAVRVVRVKDGQELMDHLRRRRAGAPAGPLPEPHLILLDLNMPRKDGREALEEIKADPALQHIPVVVLTDSVNEQEVMWAYGVGLNAFVNKPVEHAEFVSLMKTLKRFWLDSAEVPLPKKPAA